MEFNFPILSMQRQLTRGGAVECKCKCAAWLVKRALSEELMCSYVHTNTHRTFSLHHVP
jgi:hypothetical protein